MDAAQSRANFHLFPLPSLVEANAKASSQFHLSPFYSQKDVEHYYPLLETALTPVDILIQIPMKGDLEFSLWLVQPFPSHSITRV